MQILFVFVGLLVAGMAIAEAMPAKVIHSLLAPQISAFDDCLPDFDVSPPIEDDLLIKTINLSKEKKIVFTLCEPGSVSE